MIESRDIYLEKLSIIDRIDDPQGKAPHLKAQLEAKLKDQNTSINKIQESHDLMVGYLERCRPQKG